MRRMSAIKKEEKIEQMLHALRSVHPKYEVMFAIGHTTGLRISDVLGLRSNILTKGKIVVKEKKTGKKKEVVLTQEVRSLVESYCKRYRLAPREFLIFSRDYERDKHLSRVQAYRIMRAVGEEIGLEGIGTHCMRKTFAQRKFEATGDIVALQKEMNHRYVGTTIMYLANGDLSNIRFGD